MPFLSKIIKAGLINKAINEARKPQNQQKAKDLMQSLMSKRRGNQAPGR